MSILILGKNSILGNYIYRYLSGFFENIIGINDDDIINDTNNIEKTILKIREIISVNSFVINCMEIVSNESKDITKMISTNCHFPLIVAVICIEKNSKLIQCSTDCVFNCIMGEYSPTSTEYTRDIYGLTKLFGEVKMSNTVIIRTSIIGKDENNNLLVGLSRECSKDQSNTIGYTDHYWNGITCLQYAKEIKKIIYNFNSGVVHFYSMINNKSTGCTKFELIQLLNSIYNLNLNIIPTHSNEFIDSTLTGTCVNTSLEVQIKEMKDFDEIE